MVMNLPLFIRIRTMATGAWLGTLWKLNEEAELLIINPITCRHVVPFSVVFLVSMLFLSSVSIYDVPTLKKLGYIYI